MFTPVCNNNMYSLVVLRYMYSCILVFSALMIIIIGINLYLCNVIISAYIVLIIIIIINNYIEYTKECTLLHTHTLSTTKLLIAS